MDKEPAVNFQKEQIPYSEATIDTGRASATTQDILKDVVSAEILGRGPGLNVMGEGGNPMYHAWSTWTESISTFIKVNPEQAKEILVQEGILSRDEADRIPQDQLLEEIQKKQLEEYEKNLAIRMRETEMLDDLAVERVRLHFDESPHHLSHIVKFFDEEGNFIPTGKDPVSEELKKFIEYYQRLSAGGKKIELTLGPGIAEPGDDKRRGPYKASEYRLPTTKEELEIWRTYCKGIAKNFSEADFTVWVEPNFYPLFEKTGRDPEKYGRAVLAAARTVQEVLPAKKIGISVVFADVDYLNRALNEIKKSGVNPADIIQYISINPYRWGMPERPTAAAWDEGSKKFGSGEKPFLTYEQQILNLYEEMKGWGITDIRTGETGYDRKDSNLSEHEQAVYNLRGWILNRYLWVAETPFRATQVEGSRSQRGLVSEEGIPTETYFAYRNFNSVFNKDFMPAGELTVTDDMRIFCKVFKNQSTQEMLLAVWVAQSYGTDESQYRRKIKFSNIGGDRIEIATLTDKEVQWKRSDGALLSDEGIEVGSEPIFIKVHQSILPPTKTGT
jgi:polyhydroxyalkanoate synthesis regulator phasin